MDAHSLPPPFHTRDFHLQQQQFHHNNNSEEEHSATTSRLKRDRDDDDLNNSGGDGAAADGEITRRPRGRPAGSKNKPKPPIIITRDSANALRTHVIEVTDGCDIVDSVATFARRRQRGVCIMSGTGTVTNVTLRQPASLVQLSTYTAALRSYPLPVPSSLPPAPPAATSLTIYLAGGQGQVVGGSVVGTLIASGPVVIMAASFSNAAYERLPLEDDDQPPLQGGGGIGSPDEVGQSQPAQTAHHQQQQQQQQLLADGNAPLFHGLPPNLLNSIQMPPSEAAYWATARPPY